MLSRRLPDHHAPNRWSAALDARRSAGARLLDLSEANVKVIIHRSRRRYRDLLKEEVARTVERKDEVDDELKELFAALS